MSLNTTPWPGQGSRAGHKPVGQALGYETSITNSYEAQGVAQQSMAREARRMEPDAWA